MELCSALQAQDGFGDVDNRLAERVGADNFDLAAGPEDQIDGFVFGDLVQCQPERAVFLCLQAFRLVGVAFADGLGEIGLDEQTDFRYAWEVEQLAVVDAVQKLPVTGEGLISHLSGADAMQGENGVVGLAVAILWRADQSSFEVPDACLPGDHMGFKDLVTFLAFGRAVTQAQLMPFLQGFEHGAKDVGREWQLYWIDDLHHVQLSQGAETRFILGQQCPYGLVDL